MKVPFDKVYCLHLLEEKERFNHCVDEFNRIGLDVTFWNTTKKKLDVALGKNIQTLHNNHYDTYEKQNPYIYGAVFDCAYNHYRIIKEAYIQGFNNILIMEDDITFSKNIKLIENTFNSLPENYSIIKYFYGSEKYYECVNTNNHFDILPGIDIWLSTLCYALSRAGMKQIIDSVENYGLKIADSEHKYFNEVYIPLYPICHAFGLNSTILNDNTNFIPASGYVEINHYNFVIIPKNACTTLMALSFKLENQSFNKIHNEVHINNKLLKGFSVNNAYPKVAIYRDPIERFISIYNNRDKHENRCWGNISNIGDFINFAKAEQEKSICKTYKSNGCDEHFIPQYKFYNLKDIDIIVQLKDLNSFIKEKLHIINPINKNKSNGTLEKSQLTVNQIKEIINIYKKDYILFDDIVKSDKLYKP